MGNDIGFGGIVSEHDAYLALVVMAERDGRWMRRLRRRTRWAGWRKEILRWSLACGTLGPIAPCLTTPESWTLLMEEPLDPLSVKSDPDA